MDWGVLHLRHAGRRASEQGEEDRESSIPSESAQEAGVTSSARCLARSEGRRPGASSSFRVVSLRGKIARRRQGLCAQRERQARGEGARCSPRSELSVKNMTASGGARKKGLNREILSTAPSAFLSMIRYKAEEAGVEYSRGGDAESEAISNLSRLRASSQEEAVEPACPLAAPAGLEMGRDAASAPW